MNEGFWYGFLQERQFSEEGSGHSLNRRTLKTEEMPSSSLLFLFLAKKSCTEGGDM